MTTTKQVKQIIQPLLARHIDLTLVGRLVVIKPVKHLVRGVYIDRTSNADVFEPKWAVIFLFEPNAIISFNWGGQVYPPFKGQWRASDLRTSTAMCDAIESVALPLLRPVRTIQDFVAFASKERFPWMPLASYKRRKLFVDLALGDLQSARPVCAYCEEQSKLPTRKFSEWEKELDIYIAEKICPLVAAEDRVGIARLLHGLEADAVREEKLDHLWEPTPFPIEAASPNNRDDIPDLLRGI